MEELELLPVLLAKVRIALPWVALFGSLSKSVLMVSKEAKLDEEEANRIKHQKKIEEPILYKKR